MSLGIFSFDFYPFIGGIGRNVHNYYEYLQDLDTIIFSPCDTDIVDHIKISSPFIKYFKHISLSFWLNRHIKRIIKQHKLKAVNIHCGPGGLFLTKRLKIPLIATCNHTYWQQANYIKTEKWKKIFIPFEKKTYKLADKIICISNDSKQILISKYNIDEQKITVIPCSVNTKKFIFIKEIKRIPKSVLYVGRLDERKGIRILIESIPEIIKTVSNIHFYIGGKGPLENSLKNFVKENNLFDNVTFLGFISDDDLVNWYNKVSCLVIPSLFEGFGIITIEALACETPVIGANVDGIKSIIRSGENGYLFNINNKHDLVEKVSSLIKSQHLQEIFRENGRKDIEEYYSDNVISDKLRKYFQNL